ncbi:MAG: SDR family NAD(P)-dependent oxidoreductase, partial [Planctomycetota bacterium]
MFTSIAGKSVLVTGGSKGIGKGIATVFAKAGANIMIAARSEEAAKTTADEMTAAGLRVAYTLGDVGEWGDVQAIVKATAPLLQEHGTAITTLFYKRMLDAHPELRGIFSATSQATGAQPRALARAVLKYATYADDLPKLATAVERIAQKHASLFVEPAQYSIVGEHLLAAIG